MDQDEQPIDAATPEAALEAEAPAAADAAGEAGEAPAPARDPDDGPDSGPLADAPPAPLSADDRPREVVRGIHAELLCQCPECEPEHVELQWFSPEEAKKVKGDAMLYCARSSRKYFTPIVDLTAWLTANGGPRKGRRGE